jgi:hypothetical protein
MADKFVVADGSANDVAGHRPLEGTDLELSYSIDGDDLMLRVNKGPVLVFRVRLRDVLKAMSDSELMNFNAVAPDFIFDMSDSRARMYQLAKGLGLADEELEKLKMTLLG